MQDQLSSQLRSECFHVVAAASGAAVALSVALASAAAGEVAFGDGFELSLTRVGDQVTVPDWIQLFPKGPAIDARDGRRWTLANPQVVLDAFARNQADLPLDLNHASELLGPKGGDAPAQAWIKEMAIRDGAVWARVEWNDAGRVAVASRSYRYVSPAFTHAADGQITGVKSAALVTQPALVMPALAHLQTAPPEKPVMTLATRLAAVYGLAAVATDDQIYEAATTQVALARDARDPTKLVPASDLQVALTRATTAEATIAAAAATAAEAGIQAAVDGAVAAGKISPAGKEHWIAVARADLGAFNQAIASMPATLTPPTPTQKKVDEATGEAGLTEQQLGLARDLGLTPAAFAAELTGAAQ